MKTVSEPISSVANYGFTRYTGAKTTLSRKFLPYYPSNAEDYDYVEPFVGLGSVAYRVINSVPFRSFRLSDCFDWAVRYLLALRGDLTDHGDIVDRLKELRRRLLPEHNHEYSIRMAFEDFKEPCRAGDYLAYAFICNYAREQLVYPQRKDLAFFDPTNLGAGISYMTVEKALGWRETLQRSTIIQQDAFEVLESLDGSSYAYIDPPYFCNGASDWRMFAHELSDGDHERLRDILHNASFPWMLSINDHVLTWKWYIELRKFRIVPVRYRTAPRRASIPKYYEWLILND